MTAGRRPIRLASRGSALARWQTEYVRRRIEALHPDVRVEIRILRTQGDRITDVPLARIGDKGLFTKEIDRAVLSGEADAAVHSLKDVPTRLEAGLALGAVLEREDPSDAFVPAPGRPSSLDSLHPGAVVGTSSLRRRALLLSRRTDLAVRDLRGNLDTRLAKLERGELDAAILARAGLRRLGLDAGVGQLLEPPEWLPAVGQGALAVAIREDDAELRQLIAPLDHAATRLATVAERAFLRRLEGGCQVPIGALARVEGSRLRLHGFVASLDGATVLRGELDTGATDAGEADARALGQALARRLADQGADAILREIRGHDAPTFPLPSPP